MSRVGSPVWSSSNCWAPGTQSRSPETQPRLAVPREVWAASSPQGSGTVCGFAGDQLTALEESGIVPQFCTARIHISLLFAGEADVGQNNEAPSQDTAVTDSKRTAVPKNAWPDASPADPGGRPHLIRLFSRDAPGREDNTFKDRPSESDELQTIQEDSAAAPEGLDVMASQKRPSQRHGSKYLASASAMDHARHGFLPRHRDTGILDSLGRFFGGDRGVPKRGSGKVSSEE